MKPTPKELIGTIKSHHPFLQDGDVVGVAASVGKSATLEGDGRTLSVVATTDDIDLQDEVVVPSGADLSYFNANGKIFADHQYTIPDVVAIRREVVPFVDGKTSQAGWKVRAYMLPGNSIADAIIAIAEVDGIGTSIGFQAIDYSKPNDDEVKLYGNNRKTFSCIVRKWKWLELSFTAFPCNVSCQSLSVPVVSDDRAKATFDNLLCKGRITRHAAATLGFKEATPARTVLAVV